MDDTSASLSLTKSKDENQNYPPDILYPRLLVCIYQPILVFDIRLFAYFNLLFLLIRAKLALKNTGRASMDGARHDFAKSAAGLGLEPRFTDSESVCLPVSRSRNNYELLNLLFKYARPNPVFKDFSRFIASSFTKQAS